MRWSNSRTLILFTAQQIFTLLISSASSSVVYFIHIALCFGQVLSSSCSASQSHPTVCDSMDCSTPGFPVLHPLLELAQTHIHWVGDAIQPSCLLSSPSPPAFNLSQHQGIFQWVSSSHHLAKVTEFQFQHQSFQWILDSGFISFRADRFDLLAIQGDLVQ